MAHYVILINWTEQGVRNYADTQQRADDASQLMERMGGRMTNLWWTLGPYDLVATMEMPDDETATAAALAVSSQGNVRTTTLRAFDRDEIASVLERAPR